MVEIGRVSIRLPSTIHPGDVIRMRTLVIHPMELVQRDQQGKIVPKNYHFVRTVTVTFNDREVMRAEMTQAISQNPSFTFPLKVERPGRLIVAFSDTTGKIYQGLAGRFDRRRAVRLRHGARRRLRAGSIWRAGEGHVKLRLALFFFRHRRFGDAPFARAHGSDSQLGSAIFMPNAVAWVGAVWGVFLLLVLWYLLCGWLEQRRQAGY